MYPYYNSVLVCIHKHPPNPQHIHAKEYVELIAGIRGKGVSDLRRYCIVLGWLALQVGTALPVCSHVVGDGRNQGLPGNCERNNLADSGKLLCLVEVVG